MIDLIDYWATMQALTRLPKCPACGEPLESTSTVTTGPTGCCGVIVQLGRTPRDSAQGKGTT